MCLIKSKINKIYSLTVCFVKNTKEFRDIKKYDIKKTKSCQR